MGIFKSLKSDYSNDLSNDSKTIVPPPGPPPSKQHNAHSDADAYAPPPSYQSNYQQGQDVYTPPPGPPPSRVQYMPPPGPPPSHTLSGSFPDNDQEPPPYHDWTVIPDNALLPPPPSLGHNKSPSGNAHVSDAVRAHEWCSDHPMVTPHRPTPVQHSAVINGDVRLMKPQEYKGDLLMPNTGFWKGFTRSGSKDSCVLTSAPLYFAAADAPTQVTKTIYYELKVRSLGRGRGTDKSSIALGYCAMPYPTWRMPGWERGSLGVHGDDGRRYVNDTYGGKDFTSPFQIGDTLGLGMSFSVAEQSPEYSAPPQNSIKVEVFLTRNGEKTERWNLHEELDASEDSGVDGLDGKFDLYAAIGTFGGVEFDVSFNRQYWLWRPR